MKKIRKTTFLLVVVLSFSLIFSFTCSAHDDIKDIAENDKIYAHIPLDYEASSFSDNFSYSDDEGNYLEFCVGENKFAVEGITALKDWQIQTVFEHFYLYGGDLERTDECFVGYELTEKREANGYSGYFLQGNYSYNEEDINTEWSYSFNAYIFATKENIFVIGYEDIEGNTENYGDLMVAVNSMVLNGTHFDGDKPERNAEHDFSDSPSYEEALINFQGPIFEDGVLGIASVIVIIMTVVPTLIVIIIAIVLIRKYNKNKKVLRQYKLTYGNIPQYNTYPQNYGGYGYNQPVNQPYQPYQPPVNSAYQQNPVNQNVPQTPSYVTNAVNNLENAQPTQPAQENIPPEMQENKINNENKI